MSALVKLLHEVWDYLGEDGQWLPGCMLAGPDGDGMRAFLGIEAKRITTFEAGSHFEAMTIYHRLVGYEPYTTVHKQDYEPYREDALMRQVRER